MKNPIKKIEYDVVVIGSGPAGMSAAIYTGRAGLKTLILEKEAPGGKIIKTEEIENYPGFERINGPDLAIKFYNQVNSYGVEYIYTGIKKFEKINDVFKIVLDNTETVTSKTIIIATGTRENKIGVEGEDKFYGKGVSYCAVCDAAFYKEQQICVVGGGYSAIEEAIFLTRFASKVYIIHRRDKFRADDKQLTKAKNNPKIEFILDSVVEKITGDTKVASVHVKNLKTSKKIILDVKAIFPFIGSVPNTAFIKDTTILDENKNIITDAKMETEISGLFAAGDVRNTPLRQVATAVGDGAMAGQKVVEYIEKL